MTYGGPVSPWSNLGELNPSVSEKRRTLTAAAWSLLFPTRPPPFWLSSEKGRERKREKQEERERGLGEREKSKVMRRKERFQSAFGHSKRNQFKSDYEKQRDVLSRQRGNSWNSTQVGLGKVLEQGPRLSSAPRTPPGSFSSPPYSSHHLIPVQHPHLSALRKVHAKTHGVSGSHTCVPTPSCVQQPAGHL